MAHGPDGCDAESGGSPQTAENYVVGLDKFRPSGLRNENAESEGFVDVAVRHSPRVLHILNSANIFYCH